MEELYKEIAKIYSSINRILFLGELKLPNFSVEANKKYIFRFEANGFRLNIGGEFAKTDNDSMLLHLLHEMIHIYNNGRKVSDCRANQYHNKNFLDIALECGLYVGFHPNLGWGITSLTNFSAERVASPFEKAIRRRNSAFNIKINGEVISKAKREIVSYQNKRQINYFLKYECKCPLPHNSIRSGRRPDGKSPLHIKCLVCNEVFECVDPSYASKK